jgi:DNA-binding transcriptional MerR regulator
MRATGMSIALMHRYADLVKRGSDTAAERRRILEEHKRTVEERIGELQEIVRFIDKKIDYHRALEANGGVDSEETRRMLEELDHGANTRK